MEPRRARIYAYILKRTAQKSVLPSAGVGQPPPVPSAGQAGLGLSLRGLWRGGKSPEPFGP